MPTHWEGGRSGHWATTNTATMVTQQPQLDLLITNWFHSQGFPPSETGVVVTLPKLMDGLMITNLSLLLFLSLSLSLSLSLFATYALNTTSPEVCLRDILTFSIELSGLCTRSL